MKGGELRTALIYRGTKADVYQEGYDSQGEKWVSDWGEGPPVGWRNEEWVDKARFEQWVYCGVTETVDCPVDLAQASEAYLNQYHDKNYGVFEIQCTVHIKFGFVDIEYGGGIIDERFLGAQKTIAFVEHLVASV